MPSKNTTTVVLTDMAQAVKDDLAPIFGLKAILSAGLVLFARLSAEDQKKAIAEASDHVLKGSYPSEDALVTLVRDLVAEYASRSVSAPAEASEAKPKRHRSG